MCSRSSTSGARARDRGIALIRQGIAGSLEIGARLASQLTPRVAAENSKSEVNARVLRVGAVVLRACSFTSALFSWLACRFRSRADLELEVIALRHQLAVLRRQRPGRTRIASIDRLLCVYTSS